MVRRLIQKFFKDNYLGIEMKKTLTTILLISICSGAYVLPIKATNITSDQVGEIATTYIKRHPDKMLDIMKSMQASLQVQQYDEVKRTIIAKKSMLLDHGFLPTIGNPKASKTLVFFFDFQCIYCHKEYPLIKKLIVQDTDVKVVLLPLNLFGQASLYANKVALYAAIQHEFRSFLRYD